MLEYIFSYYMGIGIYSGNGCCYLPEYCVVNIYKEFDHVTKQILSYSNLGAVSTKPKLTMVLHATQIPKDPKIYEKRFYFPNYHIQGLFIVCDSLSHKSLFHWKDGMQSQLPPPPRQEACLSYSLLRFAAHLL
ncbi:MAG: hypothetical protein AEth_00659 [Candidatus Argoarchaeum ethanivorans]|uniref:Uncharacterized protein n=1 Tax=Candidatus Argoarchaeum ethanivorans TaxID=2608793 RepID=A0A8B3S5D8_9EURY|nr:MAG: hypothetical protein AEth_00659 [Candidatus Argoarchaeum ethanivorans]